MRRTVCVGGADGDDAVMKPAPVHSTPEPAAVLCIEQRQCWRAGERVPAEDYLRRYPALGADPEQAVDLVYGEFLLRERLGERPDPEEYLRRFPAYADLLREQINLHRAMGAAADTLPADPDLMAEP